MTELLDNFPSTHLIKSITKIGGIWLFFMASLAVIVIIIISPPTTLQGYIILLALYLIPLTIGEYVNYKSIDWHFSKIRFTPEGIHFYRDKVKYLPKHRFIPWEKILGFDLGKNAMILTINYNPYYLFGEAKEKTPYYFLLYGVKKNPKIKEFIERRYPFLFEQYRDVLKEDGEK